MKKIFLILSVCTIVALSSLTVFAIDGDGTEETPFLITNQGDLELVTDFPDCHFRLANDIELEGTWIPICKQTSSGYFSGVFDGAGYTISNLTTDGSEGGLFKNNSGIIKNLNVKIVDEGMTGTGVISNYNSGTISNCVVNGNISSSSTYVGGISAHNNKIIEQCKFIGNIENTSVNGYLGGMCGYNSEIIEKCVGLGNFIGKSYIGGVCGYSLSGEISDCYFIGNIDSSSLYKGGIVGRGIGDTYSNSYVRYCYSAATFDSEGFGISGHSDSKNYLSVTESYYDKTISGLTSTNYGTPKSTSAMKMKQTYVNDWDFDTTWGIDKNINNGYPYLLWEYPNAEVENPYTVNSVKLIDLSGNELEEIPTESFYFEINVTKNDNSKNADSLIIALYDENGAFIDLKYMSGIYYQNQSITFGAMINKMNKRIGNIKGFVWSNVLDMTPLSNSLGITN